MLYAKFLNDKFIFTIFIISFPLTLFWTNRVLIRSSRNTPSAQIYLAISKHALYSHVFEALYRNKELHFFMKEPQWSG
jgi:hypothetical protein